MTQKKVPAIETLPIKPVFSEALTMYVFKALLHRWMDMEATTKDYHKGLAGHNYFNLQ
jgi:hypothetical protein